MWVSRLVDSHDDNSSERSGGSGSSNSNIMLLLEMASSGAPPKKYSLPASPIAVSLLEMAAFGVVPNSPLSTSLFTILLEDEDNINDDDDDDDTEEVADDADTASIANSSLARLRSCN